MEINNTPPSTKFSLYVGDVDDNTFANHEFIPKDRLKSISLPSFVKDELLIPDENDDHDFLNGDLDLESFQHTTQHLFRLSGYKIFFTEDVEGWGDDMVYGGLFKFDDTKIGILNLISMTNEETYEKLENLKKKNCSVQENIVPAFEEFDKIVEKANSCIKSFGEQLALKKGVGGETYFVNSVCYCEPVELDVPGDWLITLHPKSKNENYLLLLNPKEVATPLRQEQVKRVILTEAKEGSGWQLYQKPEFGTSVKELGTGKHTVYPVTSVFGSSILTGTYDVSNLVSLVEKEPYYIRKCEGNETNERDDSLAKEQFDNLYSNFDSGVNVTLPKEYFVKLVQEEPEVIKLQLIKNGNIIRTRKIEKKLCTYDGTNNNVPLAMANINRGKMSFNPEGCFIIGEIA
jgi:hypothetical protein